ncbi:SURF1 family protein [Rhizobiales bacterium]|uniref:SURF1 family protein n=1 Tax=Hongsoonwoonella zoysiae TaxID=2821844 RepID=UPI0015602FB4|nr:SURF1 family protein [Hongsoonwoonella zoysiae]NRG19794.1 SURF1 family protein [Hongsoonwoonella zoysiae]
MTSDTVLQRKRPVWLQVLWPSVAAAIAFAVLVSLGAWQVERLAWKESLIENVNARRGRDPVAAPGPDRWHSFDEERWDYTPVRLTGRYLPGELYYFISLSQPNGPYAGPGYLVFNPFLSAEGWVVMVNRGFVPQDRRLPADRPDTAPPKGTVEIAGLLRRPEHPNFLSYEPDLEKHVWFVREPERMARSLDVEAPNVAPYAVDLFADSGEPNALPRGGETIVSFRNNHLQYAGTWFGLAAVLAAVYIVFIASRLRRSQKGAED